MKRELTLQDFKTLPESVQKYIFDWQKRKGYHFTPTLTFTDCIEFLREESNKEHKEEILHGVKSHVLECEDMVLAWESSEPIDDALYEITQVIKKRLSR